MNDVAALIQECRVLGATFVPLGDRLKVKAPQPLPDDLIAALKEAKALVLVELDKERQESFRCWVLEEWRRTSLPWWTNH